MSSLWRQPLKHLVWLSILICCLLPAKLWGDVEVSLPGGEAMQLVRLEAGTFLMGTTLAQKRRWDAFNAQKHPLSFSAIPYSSEFAFIT